MALVRGRLWVCSRRGFHLHLELGHRLFSILCRVIPFRDGAPTWPTWPGTRVQLFMETWCLTIARVEICLKSMETFLDGASLKLTKAVCRFKI